MPGLLIGGVTLNTSSRQRSYARTKSYVSRVCTSRIWYKTTSLPRPSLMWDGIIGTESADIIKVLQNAKIKIPMVSTAPDDNLANISDYLYSIAPSNNDQAMAMLRYAQALDAKKVALFVDVCDGYSKDLA